MSYSKSFVKNWKVYADMTASYENHSVRPEDEELSILACLLNFRLF